MGRHGTVPAGKRETVNRHVLGGLDRGIFVFDAEDCGTKAILARDGDHTKGALTAWA